MPERTRQIDLWDGEFGRRYWERHPTTVEGFDRLRTDQWGFGQSDVMGEFLDRVDRDATVLEVGCGIGIQLEILHEMGFENLYGVDVHTGGLRRCRRDRSEIEVLKATATDLPFRDGEFDLVFTNETLVTVPPESVDAVIDEIVRCSNEWIWGLEFHADEYTEIEWRGEERMLWKTDFLARYLDRHGLDCTDERFIEYRENDDLDRAFLLRNPE
ncbi:pseudaminic acid biosynthesis-associated methylase [Halorussus salinus]|uniref:pseudaminic acid biosynthesis-associated methylase n=1 Tax=Halorussus salinus TaxID=1364935 RepID=UPI00138F769A|nr:pseudaminic acid biosynthesis-associated methylase [Halorussus salinus]